MPMQSTGWKKDTVQPIWRYIACTCKFTNHGEKDKEFS